MEFVCLVLLDLYLLEPYSSPPQLQYGVLLEAITAKEKRACNSLACKDCLYLYNVGNKREKFTLNFLD